MKNLRRTMGLSAATVADLMGVSVATLYRMERGGTGQATSVTLKWMIALGVDEVLGLCLLCREGLEERAARTRRALDALVAATAITRRRGRRVRWVGDVSRPALPKKDELVA